LSAALTYQEGFPIFGVHQDPGNLRNEDPHAEFQLLKLPASYTDTSHKLVTWHSELNVQYAFEGLLVDQQLYLSDPFALLGWSHVTIAADSGVVWRNELILRLSPPVGTEARLSGATLERAIVPYAFNDLGYTDSTKLGFQPVFNLGIPTIKSQTWIAWEANLRLKYSATMA